MKRELLHYLKCAVAVLGALLCLYTVAYALIVRRIVSPGGGAGDA